ncbi:MULTISPECIES: hypothetical protein [unclassified Nostoc]|uniref:hypothetical protein n=1 Tax=unclassified Nostoc TaxID=2593658 RepID=UPI002AD20CB1|nr:hypothetical protein [Nostoc sp. DedQUE03]MDZ7973441.1 hypothetical protein [Nostoc sp. DedQUE03]MDZ8045057.1 hypothetical protein [Nostoc sp. DedQUE02]
MKTLSELVAEASLLISEIYLHPDHQALIEKGYYPDLTVGDAFTALAYLTSEINPPVITVPEIPEIEVTDESRA